jgi:uncharacterized membrane protein YgcG
VQTPLPACFERIGDGAWRKLVQDPDAITSAWRVNHGAAKTGSDPQPVSVMPPAPAAYRLPKTVLQRQPTDKLFERQERPRCVSCSGDGSDGSEGRSEGSGGGGGGGSGGALPVMLLGACEL